MKCLFLRLKNNYLRNESGQALIEYVLILVVVIGIIFGGIYQLNQAFRSWANNYFGEYLSCLIETGELPALGGPAGECNQSFKAFSLADGRPLVNSSAGETNPAETGSFKGGSGGGAISGGGNYSGADGSGYVQRLPNQSFAANNRISRFKTDMASDGGEGGSSTGSAQITELGDGSGGKIVRMPLRQSTGLSGSVRAKLDDEEKKNKFKANGVTAGDGSEKSQHLIRIERKAASVDKIEEEEFTFGKFLRLLIIAAIIIAIVMFIGGQILQVSKSMD